jgi:predicted SnoaL-like aldol condensation-catalyzing enzyme
LTKVSSDQLSKNKQVVSDFFAVVYGNGDDLHKFDDLIAEDYIQHNPHVDQGREGVRRFFEQEIKSPDRLDPRETLEVNLIAEGDLVVRQEIRTQGMLIDVFRVRDGQLQEHWDAYRPNPGTERHPAL